jgi:6-phosphogluconolactonase
MALLAMIGGVPIPEENVHRIRTEKGTVADAAREYESELRRFATREPGSMGTGPFPQFDLILLGLGLRGFTASLFAGRSELKEKERWVVPMAAPQNGYAKERVTMTLPVIDHARCVAFLLFGEARGAILEEILKNPEKAAEKYPAAMVRPAGELVWFVA